MNTDRARDLLTAELADLEERARFAESTRSEASADLGAIGQHPGDEGSEVAGAMDSELLVDTVADQRRHVEEALARLDDGTYGTCTVCGRAIDDERLEARPEATTCRDHADTPAARPTA